MTRFSRAQANYREKEEQQHAEDSERRLLKTPHKHPLSALNSSRSGVAFGLHETSVAVGGGVGVDGRAHPTVKSKVALSDEGTPRFSDTLLVAMSQGAAPPMPRHYLTIAQVAELRDVSHDVVRQDAVEKRLQASRMGAGYRSHYRVSLPALRAYLVLLGESDEYILACMNDARTLVEKRG